MVMINYLNEPHWQAYPNYPIVPATLQNWLFYQGSFVARLENDGIKKPEIIVLKRHWELPLLSERLALKSHLHHYALVREVLIKSDEKVWMYARTVFPQQTLTGPERQLLFLKNRSLGTVLFNYPHLQRSEFELACLNPGSTWYKKITQFTPLNDEPVWARRSIFIVNNKPILLSEVYLPDMNKI